MGILRPTPKQKDPRGSRGTESEMIIATELVRAGYTVLTPYGYMHRYDLVIEDADGRFWKIQCKTAWLSTQTEGALVLKDVLRNMNIYSHIWTFRTPNAYSISPKRTPCFLPAIINITTLGRPKTDVLYSIFRSLPLELSGIPIEK
jgi:PD-(D/E)XK endonuclease